ncbi:MAG: hypothetical protein JRN45_00655 [Nitrososphaerota archaeon]|nr:hypothetical protein [Nitrososphaerota archaeon]
MMPPEEAPRALREYNEWVRTLAHSPLKVTLKLSSAVAAADYIAFDGLLYYAVLSRTIDDKLYGEYAREGSHFLDPLLPLWATHRYDADGGVRHHFYLASVAAFDTPVVQTDRWRKRTTDFDSDRGKVDISRGTYKMFDAAIPCTPATEAVFWAFGNKEEVGSLLSEVPAIGKKTAYGYGNVSSYTVEEVEGDSSLVGSGGALNRCVPAECVSVYEGDAAVRGYRPPYWKKQNHVRCVLPGSKAVLKGLYLPKHYRWAGAKP